MDETDVLNLEFPCPGEHYDGMSRSGIPMMFPTKDHPKTLDCRSSGNHAVITLHQMLTYLYQNTKETDE